MHKKVVLITGSTSGIGEGIARCLCNSGYIVALHSVSSVQKGTYISW